jgi:DNA sulfur modification protein DndD
LKNYRQYRDALIDFRPFLKEKNFTIIVGNTGSGKTNLMNAITWCLYGVEYNIRDKDRGLPLINLATLDEMKEDETQEVSVEIQASATQDERIIFSRVLNFKKKKDKPEPMRELSSKSVDGSTFTMLRQVRHNTVPVPDPEFVLSRLIPQSIEEYFLFDGERLNDYFKQASKMRIKEAVLKISQIGLLENLIKHLQDRKNEFTRMSKDMSSEAANISESLQTWTRSKEKEEEELSKLRSDKEEAQVRFEEIVSKLQTSKSVDVQGLEEERTSLERDLDELDSRLIAMNKEKLKLLVDNASCVMLNAPLTKLSELIKAREESGRIPPEYRKGFLERLLRDGKCICGADLAKEETRRKNVVDLLKGHDEMSELSNLLIRLAGTINGLQDKCANFDKARTKINVEIADAEKRREKASRRIKQIDESIGSVDVNEIRQLNVRRQDWFNRLQELVSAIAKKELQVQEYQKRIEALDRALKVELRKDKRSQELANVCDFCDDALEVAQAVKAEIMKEIREEIEKKTEEQFFSLIWKASDYKKVSINEEYVASVTHQSGLEGIGTLSAGEGIVLALSFMAAINSISGFDVPIVIDTPLGRIAGAPRERVAENLPRYLPGKQVTMLVTDTEYTETVRSLLGPRVGKTFNIEFTESGAGGVAKVVPIE